MSGVQARRYRLLSVLGEGGFGRVYKARLESGDGFVKDVAVKVHSRETASEEDLARFRDEARILGLVRDRAIVTVDPPTRLQGRWAVVMEYVDGVSLHALTVEHGELPAKVAVGVVQEVARALENVYSAPGPDGEPLKLLHRDIKPSNLLLTRSGEVKILDFGIARAEFAEREAQTQANIGGTIGYIAPERLVGNEGPSGDIYSLGIVLRTVVTGIGPRHWLEQEETSDTVTDAAAAGARALAGDMTNLDPKERPTARQVQDLCARMMSTLPGPTLSTWASQHVPALQQAPPEDDMVGHVLTETLAAVPKAPDVTQGMVVSRPVVVGAAMGSAGLVVAVAVLVVAILAMAWVVVRAPDTQGPAVVPGTPGIADVMPPEEEEAKPVPVAAPSVKPRPKAVVHAVTFVSEPPGAEFFLDGKLAGKTPKAIPLDAGAHKVRFVWGFDSIEAEINVGEKFPTQYLWEVGEPLQVSF